MRPTVPLLLACLALSGCLSAAEVPSPTPAPPAPSPFAAEGVAWLPGSDGPERAETLLPFPVNASGMGVTATLRLGSRYAAELPTSTADVVAELRAPDGAVLAQAALRQDKGLDAALTATSAVAGEHVLALLSYAGSDGASMGDYVAWRLEAA